MIIGMALAGGMLQSCKEDTPLPYDGLTGITFQPVNMFTDNLPQSPSYPVSSADTNFVKEFFFAYDEGNTYRIFQAPVAVLGYVVDFDRPVAIEVAPSSTLEEGSYEIATDFCVVGSGKMQGVLNVKVDRPDINDKSVKKLVIKLVPNDYFSYVNGNGQYFICYLSNSNYKPRFWDYSLGVAMTEYFGLYSEKKFEFMHQVFMEYEREDYWTGETTCPYQKYATLEGLRALGGGMDPYTGISGEELQQCLKIAYAEYKAAGNDPIIDDNTEKEIVFGY